MNKCGSLERPIAFNQLLGFSRNLDMEKLKLPSDGTCEWAGMGNYNLKSPDGSQNIDLIYVGEPPHGDSYHHLIVNGKRAPGFAWGCLFAFSENSRYLVLSWMAKLVERKTMVIDCSQEKYFILPEYICSFSIDWPLIKENEGEHSYVFSGSEQWSNL